MPQLVRPTWSRSLAAALAVLFVLAEAGCQGSGDPAALVAEARAYRQHGDSNAAVIQLKNALQQNPDDRPARLLLGEVYLEQGDAVSAEKELRRARSLGAGAAELDPLLGQALLWQGQFERLLDEVKPPAAPAAQRSTILALRANALLGLTKVDQAGQMFKEALQANPANAQALLGLARIAFANRATDEADALLAHALAADPADIECLRLKGDLLRAQGKTDAALAAYRAILVLRPGNGQAHIDIANMYIDSGKFKDARAEIAAARKGTATTVAALYAQALLDFREGKHAAALESLQQILRAAPEHMPTILLLGAVQYALGNNQQAEENLQKFLAAYPRQLYASKQMAALDLRLGRPQAALERLLPLLDERGDDVELLTLAGEASLRTRQFDRAAGFFEKASALRPDASALHTAVAVSRLGNGENGRAVAELERAASLDNKTPRTGVLLVMTYLQARTPDKALAAVNEMAKNGSNPLVENLKGGVYLAKQDLKGARASFDKALALDPAYMPALDNLAQLDALEKHPADTRKRYLAALDKSPRDVALLEALARLAVRQGNAAEAMGWLERACKENPESLALSLRLADFYARAGEKEKALVLAQKLQASNPSNPDALAMLAQVYMLGQNQAGAADSYTRLAALMPGSPGPLLKLASVQLAMRNPTAAIGSLRRALAIEPDSMAVNQALLDALIGQQNYAEALALATHVQKRHPDDAAGFQFEGQVLSVQNQPAQALKAYEHAFALQRGSAVLIQIHAELARMGKLADADARMALWLKDHPGDVAARLYFASSKSLRNDDAGAIEQLKALLSVDPKNVAALNDLAWSYQRINDKNALAFAERAYGLAPDSAAVMDTLGWICVANGDLKRATPLLRKAGALSPGSGEIGYHLAMALAKSGDRPAARKELERALAGPAEFASRAQAKAFLATL